MQPLESDDKNPDSALHVRFYSKPVQNAFKSEMEKRPIFEDIDCIRITTPGNKLNIIDTPVTEEHKARFPIQWARYQNARSSEGITGTPLDQWPMVTRAQAETLRHLGFHTVESVALASDQQIAAVGMAAGMAPSAFRQKAAAWLKSAEAAADEERHQHELAQRDAQIAEMQRQLQEQQATFMAKFEELRAQMDGGQPPAEPEKRSRGQRAA